MCCESFSSLALRTRIFPERHRCECLVWKTFGVYVCAWKEWAVSLSLFSIAVGDITNDANTSTLSKSQWIVLNESRISIYWRAATNLWLYACTKELKRLSCPVRVSWVTVIRLNIYRCLLKICCTSDAKRLASIEK